jgi:hypothetical protein
VSWCDKLASMPVIGFRLDPHYAPSDSILQALIPITDALVDDQGNAAFSIDGYDIFAATFTSNSGFQYNINATHISVAFKHRPHLRPTSAGPPQLVMLSHPLPFTKLLPEASQKLIEATLLLPGAKKRKIDRVGVMATASLAPKDLTPGIARFVKYIGRPWKGNADFFNIQITAEIAKGSDWSDRCIHLVAKPEEQR